MAPEFLQAALGFAALLGLIALRCPVGLAMLLVGAGGYLYIVDLATLLNYLKTTPWHLFANYTLSVIPLFILMGAIAERGGLARDLFTAANALIGHKAGGMAMASSAPAPPSARSAAQRRDHGDLRPAALPELRRYGYDPGLSTGTIAVGGTLGILIPPSVILVVYAISTEQNIAKLFMAALIPGTARGAVLHPGDRRAGVRLRPALLPPAMRVTGEAKRRRDAHRHGRAARSRCSWSAASMAASSRRPKAPHRRHRDAGGRQPAWHARPGRDQGRRCMPDRRDLGDDLRHPARRRGVQRLPRAVAIADRVAALWIVSNRPGRPCGRGRRSCCSLYRARRGDGRARDDPADPAGLLPDRLGARFRAAARRAAIWFGILVLMVVGIG